MLSDIPVHLLDILVLDRVRIYLQLIARTFLTTLLVRQALVTAYRTVIGRGISVSTHRRIQIDCGLVMLLGAGVLLPREVRLENRLDIGHVKRLGQVVAAVLTVNLLGLLQRVDGIFVDLECFQIQLQSCSQAFFMRITVDLDVFDVVEAQLAKNGWQAFVT